jgi:hypothetical protein
VPFFSALAGIRVVDSHAGNESANGYEYEPAGRSLFEVAGRRRPDEVERNLDRCYEHVTPIDVVAGSIAIGGGRLRSPNQFQTLGARDRRRHVEFQLSFDAGAGHHAVPRKENGEGRVREERKPSW